MSPNSNIRDLSIGVGSPEQVERKRKLRISVDNFDVSVREGRPVTIAEFKQACLNRAELIRLEATSPENSQFSEWYADEANRLDLAGNGDRKALVAEALRSADFYAWLDNVPGPIKNNSPIHKKTSENWRALAEICLTS
jgi:hypothetical protein